MMNGRRTLRMCGIGATIIAATGLVATHGVPATPTLAPAMHAAATPDKTTRVLMRDVDFYVDPEIVLHIRTLRGTMTSHAGGAIVFDDKRSFTIHIAAAQVGLTAKDLSVLLNKYVFAYPGAPLKHLTVTTSGTQIVQRGTLHKGVNIPFEITAQLDVTPDGLIRMHPVRTRIFGVNGGALMKAFHISLEKLIDLHKAKGATVHGDDIFLDATAILPPPTIDGRITAIHVEGDQIVEQFGSQSALAAMPPLVPPDASARSFMFYKGGTLRFGRMFMTDAEMQIVNLDHLDPFAFDLDRYNAQLVAGYSRTLPDLGLEVYMRDLTRLGDGRATRVTLH